MAFVKTDLIQEMEKFADATSPNYIESPQSTGDAAQYWADSLNIYGLAVTPASTTQAAAVSAFIGLFNTMTPATGLVIFPTCFAAYAATLGGGMAGWVAVPPPSPINFAPVQTAAVAGADQTQCLVLMVDILDAWFRTGTATPVAGGPAVPWS